MFSSREKPNLLWWLLPYFFIITIANIIINSAGVIGQV